MVSLDVCISDVVSRKLKVLYLVGDSHQCISVDGRKNKGKELHSQTLGPQVLLKIRIQFIGERTTRWFEQFSDLGESELFRISACEHVTLDRAARAT